MERQDLEKAMVVLYHALDEYSCESDKEILRKAIALLDNIK